MITGLVFYQILVFLILYKQDLFIHGNAADQNLIFERMGVGGMLSLQILSQCFILIFPAFFWSKKYLINLPKIQNPVLTTSLLSLFIIFLALPAVGYLTQINQQIPLPDFLQNSEDKITNLVKTLIVEGSKSHVLELIVAVAVIPAVAEEWMFRAVIQNQLRTLQIHPLVALSISAFIFSSIHMQFEGFLPRFLLGMILGWVYWGGGNIVYCVLLHFIFNASQVVAFQWQGEAMLESEVHKFPGTVELILATFSIVFTFALLKKYFPIQNSVPLA